MDWIAYIKQDENNALKEVYMTHRDACEVWLRSKYQVNHEDAREIFQSSIIILYDNVMTGKLTRLDSSIKSYIYSIAKNKVREHQRQQSRTIDGDRLNKQFSENGVHEKMVKESRINQVVLALNTMGDPCKSLLQLYYYKKLSMSEIGTLMGYKNADTVKNQKYKCLKRLQKLLHHHKDIEESIET